MGPACPMWLKHTHSECQLTGKGAGIHVAVLFECLQPVKIHVQNVYYD